ncbi:MAG: hypothetical protein APF76_01870 [Desulfitibacter sp. BRH_c19]|nr:MAG: hypothetical protein APF76_01870 [Desulfitibacter sp. BRH_c19]
MNVSLIIKKEEVIPIKLSGKTVIVIDVLRATSTMVTALEHGCKEIVAVSTPEEALILKKQLGTKAVLGGERNKQKLSGFDFGNSPREYIPEKILNKVLIFTTTNGTALINLCIHAKDTIICSFLNARSVISYLNDKNEVVLACAGTKGALSLEDYLLAGYIALLISKACPRSSLSEECQKAISLYMLLEKNIEGILEKTPHGQELVALGLHKDIKYCLQKDNISLVPKVVTRAYYSRIQY